MYSIGDLVIRIKNGYRARREQIDSPYSAYREEIVKKLVSLRYIESYEVSGDIVKSMKIILKYENGNPAITDVKLFSTPGRRWYVGVHELKPVLGGMGYALISTPQGILTNIEARKKKMGGELLFNIW